MAEIVLPNDIEITDITEVLLKDGQWYRVRLRDTAGSGTPQSTFRITRYGYIEGQTRWINPGSVSGVCEFGFVFENAEASNDMRPWVQGVMSGPLDAVLAVKLRVARPTPTP